MTRITISTLSHFSDTRRRSRAMDHSIELCALEKCNNVL